MTLSKEELRIALDEALNKKRTIDNETHTEHHEFLKAYMVRWEARQKMWQRFKTSFFGSIAMAIVGILMWIGQLIIDHWQK